MARRRPDYGRRRWCCAEDGSGKARTTRSGVPVKMHVPGEAAFVAPSASVHSVWRSTTAAYGVPRSVPSAPRCVLARSSFCGVQSAHGRRPRVTVPPRARRAVVKALSGRELVGVAARTSGEALARLDVKRASVWLALCIVVISLRSFFPVILGTFIVGYVANSVVRWISRISKGSIPRRAIVAFFYTSVITAITAFSLVTVPTVVRESQYFVRTLQSENPYVIAANVMRRTLGDDLATKLETFVVFSVEAPAIESSSSAHAAAQRNVEAARRALTPRLPVSGTQPAKARVAEAQPEWSPERSRRLGMLLQKSIRGYIAGTAALITRLVGTSTKVVFKAILSLLFSFMIMWDLPVIMEGVRRLGAPKSRVRYAYDELAPFFTDFGSVLGKSFEAQGAIALVNTTLTTLGLIILAVPGIGFLSVVTLVCSFIPVAGVFISTLPMLILALTEYGAAKALAVIVMVIVVHLIEAYVLNPQIYSAHLHLHPFFVLVVLYVAEHMYGIGGLLMAVPVSVYLLRSLVLGELGSSQTTEPKGEGSMLTGSNQREEAPA